ncbi:protein of unknown function [Micropruina glycogenica]|uniref:Uncharacterized protein n=1 Tax=Micropruina glycogenica TaxID=75385 RepID=A0A2N9JJ62_9ACTN|nr:protein of unknown function [Micropruina glycogenica]
MNAVALGDDLATALGADARRTRILVIVAVTLLCGAATAAVGPAWFVGLMVPHVARWICGPDQRWIIGLSLLIGPTLLLGADVLGRGGGASGRAAGRPGDRLRRRPGVDHGHRRPERVRQVHPAAGAQPIADSVRRPGGARRPRHRVVPVAARGSPIGPAAAELDRP